MITDLQKQNRSRKQWYNNGSIGYWIQRSFYSATYSKHLLYIKKKEYTPF